MGFFSRMMQRADERRRKRERMEEIVSWLMLPVLILIGYLIYREVWPIIKKPVNQFLQEMNNRPK